MGIANVGTDSLHVHVYLDDLMTKVFFKRIKTFLVNVTFLFSIFGVPKVHACMIILYVDARIYSIYMCTQRV